MSIYLRFANEADSHELIKLNQEFNGKGTTEDHIKECLRMTNELVVVAVDNDSVTGFACAQKYVSFCYESLQGEITEMYVREAFRRRGIASAMISFLEEKLYALGVRSIKILTGKENETAISAYKNSEYILTDEILLTKKLQ